MIRLLTACALMLGTTTYVATPAPKADPSALPDRVRPAESYPRETLLKMQDEKRAALRESDAFVIRAGMVFHVAADGAVKHVENSFGIVQIVMHRGTLAALQGDGDIYALKQFYDPGQGVWMLLGNSGLAIESDGRDLFALTAARPDGLTPIPRRNVWAYRIDLNAPRQGWEQDPAFDDAHVGGAVDLVKSEGKVFAVMPSKARVRVSRMD